MANELLLDASAYSDMVSQWEDGGVYRIELIVQQSSNDGKTWKGTVSEVTDYGDAEVEEEAPVKAPPAKKAAYKEP